MLKLILGLILLCIIISFIAEYWLWVLLALILLLIIYAVCLKKGYIKKADKPDSIAPASSHGDTSHDKSHLASYIVIDIETTGLSRTNDRIIEIAADKYRDGKIVEQFHRFINPGIPIPPQITFLTGITDANVKDAPNIRHIKKDFLAFIGTLPLVGHNIKTFDCPFLCAQLNHHFANNIIDTLTLAKKVFPGLLSYKLSYLDQALHLGGLEHHRAANDILITNALYLACQNPSDYKKYLKDKKALAQIPIEPKRAGYHDIDIHSIQPTNPYAQPNTPLTGKNVVFSGYFSLSLRKMMQIAVDAGATLKSHVSKKVDYLIVGTQDERFTDEDGMTSKSRTANRLIQEGEAHIQIITEQEFFKLLNQ